MSHAARVHAAIEAREEAQQADLFVQAKIDDERAVVAALEAERDRAALKVKCAPHGSLKARLRAFSEATHELMRAEGRLAKLIREAKL